VLAMRATFFLGRLAAAVAAAGGGRECGARVYRAAGGPCECTGGAGTACASVVGAIRVRALAAIVSWHPIHVALPAAFWLAAGYLSLSRSLLMLSIDTHTMTQNSLSEAQT